MTLWILAIFDSFSYNFIHIIYIDIDIDIIIFKLFNQDILGVSENGVLAKQLLSPSRHLRPFTRPLPSLILTLWRPPKGEEAMAMGEINATPWYSMDLRIFRSQIFRNPNYRQLRGAPGSRWAAVLFWPQAALVESEEQGWATGWAKMANRVINFSILINFEGVGIGQYGLYIVHSSVHIFCWSTAGRCE